MISAISSGNAGSQGPLRMETGVLDRQASAIEESKAAAERLRRETQAMVEANSGKGAATNAYRMAQILGAPPEELRLLKSG
ncbi:hypothetical protein OCH239_13475 [Roseivivax halodurans JCM 10272]|uniref:Uncharacterized protein n=1 Tax=Roseivivax halodurans JCM 10272 TaxID=1449350 RepID=X7EB27_9RHOB|nr:hypothetical protein [Roseivivax halodurans]ETX13070.1 hypothetical protein OCH239_13475 [Roseivivax halodurans JCM 10272]